MDDTSAHAATSSPERGRARCICEQAHQQMNEELGLVFYPFHLAKRYGSVS